ncbi:hypothetical protein EWM64_g8363 [Hericium alpestre]|uniref:CCHC-type domain-containing protein n=1 Tax=Hericium alpestre TaxID=135208 RepID=A0A4Y9ZQC2_9AGAM|nr:hypothetical protein EWM64_g8363 [Hericium alpestre]
MRLPFAINEPARIPNAVAQTESKPELPDWQSCVAPIKAAPNAATSTSAASVKAELKTSASTFIAPHTVVTKPSPPIAQPNTTASTFIALQTVITKPSPPIAQPAAAAPQPSPAPPPPAPVMATVGEQPGLTFFKGTGQEDETPRNFMRLFRRHMASRNQPQGVAWITEFELYLYEDSPPEDWYYGLISATLGDWVTFEAAFHAWFQLAKKAVKTSPELQQEMLDYRLSEDVLGTKELVGGRDVWMHVRWAAHMLSLAEQAGIAATDQNIWLIRREMPGLLKEFVGETHADWTAFAQAITDIDTSRLRDKVEAKQHRNVERARVQNELQHLTAQFQRLSTTALSASPQPARPQRRAATQPVEARLPTVPQAEAPLTDEPRELLRNAIRTMPQHPATDAGRVAYQAQLRAFQSTHGECPYIDECTPVPLKPGTAPVGSGECWSCGEKGHPRFACASMERVTRNEYLWRSFCNRALGGRTESPAPVQYVGADEDYERRVP